MYTTFPVDWRLLQETEDLQRMPRILRALSLEVSEAESLLSPPFLRMLLTGSAAFSATVASSRSEEAELCLTFGSGCSCFDGPAERGWRKISLYGDRQKVDEAMLGCSLQSADG